MFHHPDQIMILNTSHLHDLKTENDRWHLAAKVMQAQQTVHRPYPTPFTSFSALVNQFFNKLARSTWQAVVKPG